jgi:hypothetical protein
MTFMYWDLYLFPYFFHGLTICYWYLCHESDAFILRARVIDARERAPKEDPGVKVDGPLSLEEFFQS